MADEETKAPEEISPPEEVKEGEEAEEAVKEEESTAQFAPVVELEEVEVRSGEEDEELVHGVRAKLFLFGETLLDQGTGNKQWKERGIGEVRLLRHREHSRLRLLMRQEKTMKVIANHALDPRIRLEPNAGSDRSWVWSAYDFAGGELKETVFALRFADTEIAQAFRREFQACQAEMEKVMAGADGEPSAEADEAAEALAALSTTDAGGEEVAAAAAAAAAPDAE